METPSATLVVVRQSNDRLTMYDACRTFRILPIQITFNVEIRPYFFSRVYTHISVMLDATVASA